MERVHITVPKLRIIWRNLKPEDTGILGEMSADALYDLKVRPHLDWFKRNQVMFMPDNETSGDDNRIRKYVADESRVLDLLHTDGLNGAICRFSSGTIGDGSHGSNQYPLLKPLLDKMNAGDVISPNEYSNKPSGSSAGHLERYKLIWNAAGRPLPTVIGEAGIAVDYDAGKGYQVISMTDAAYLDYLLSQEVWYQNGAIDRCIFQLGGGYTHQSFRLRELFLTLAEDHYAKLADSPTVPPPAPPDPPKPPEPPIDLQALTVLRDELNRYANRTRSISLELATLSDDALLNAQMLTAIIRKFNNAKS